MANQNSTDSGPCDLSNAPQIVDADPDIVGPGALAAFFATAIFTITAVILGYFWDALDDTILNGLDRRLTSKCRQKWHQLRRRRTNLSFQGEDNAQTQPNRDARSDALTSFIAALSDQQLVTGLAILIAGVSDPKHLSGYEFTVVVALAWFSSTTHLTTLLTLRTYLARYGIIRNIRVVGIITVSLLLLYSYILTASANKANTLPMNCAYTYESDIALGRSFSDAGGPLYILGILTQLVPGYVRGIGQLYEKPGQRSHLDVVLSRMISRLRPGKLPFQEVLADVRAERRLSTLYSIATRQRVIRVVTIAMYGYNESFLSEFPGVIFSFTLGVCQLVSYRWVLAPPLSSDARTMAFGQYVPLLLLLLPVLTAGEAYYGRLGPFCSFPPRLTRYRISQQSPCQGDWGHRRKRSRHSGRSGT
jgi:hypothetical protein